jgi:dipeptidyl-peptidase 4
MPVWPRLDDLARLPLPGSAAPGSIAFAPDGSAITYLHSTDGSLVRALWWHELESGDRRVIAGPPAEASSEESLGLEEQLRRERTRTSELGVTDYAWAPEATVPTLVVLVGGQVYVAVGDDVRRGVTALEGADGVASAVVSPDGASVAFVRDGELWACDVAGGAPRRLTSDATDGVFNGLAEFAAAEELGRHEGLWWSADSAAVAYVHVDERHVPPFVIPHLAAASGEPPSEEHRYPFAGGPNARVRLRISEADGSSHREVELGMGPDDYLARVLAEPGGGWLVAVLPRDQRALRWLRVGRDGGARELWVERSEPWLNLDDHTRVLRDGRILRSTERTGFRHLELRAADGSFGRQLTGGQWVVAGVVHVDEDRGEVLFLATRHGATERHLYVAPLDAPEPVTDPQLLTEDPGWHEVSVSRDGSAWVDTWSDLENAPQVELRRRDSSSRATIHAPALDAASLGVRPPELLDVIADDGTTRLHAALYQPPDAEPATHVPLPCVVWVYGGPHAQYVKRAWDVTVHPLRQYLARAGVAVLVVDNRGSAYRGLGFEAPLDRALGEVEVADQVAAVRQLAERGIVDASRVAMTGGSYGGFMTIRVMARHPHLLRAGVAVAPVTAWDGYDTAYTERYLGTPQEAPDAYRAASLLDEAAELGGHLLLIHGAIDENVHLRHSIRLVNALHRAGRDDVELVILARDRHRPRSDEGIRTRDRRTVTHLLGALGLALPESGA